MNIRGWLKLAGVVKEAEANVVAEIGFTAKNAHDDPFNTVTLDVVFTDPRGNRTASARVLGRRQ